MNPNSEAAFTFRLPPIPNGLSPNARLHWAAKAKLTAQYREWARIGCLAAMREHPECGPYPWRSVLVQLTYHGSMMRDRDNMIAKAKALFDGLADAGLVGNDRLITHLPPAAIGKGQRDRHVIVRVLQGEK